MEKISFERHVHESANDNSLSRDISQKSTETKFMQQRDMWCYECPHCTVGWFQQDGTTFLISLFALKRLKTDFGDKFISYRTELPWLAISPDLWPLEYFLWKVCEIQSKIHYSINTANSRSRIWEFEKSILNNFKKRIDLCIKTTSRTFWTFVKKNSMIYLFIYLIGLISYVDYFLSVRVYIFYHFLVSCFIRTVVSFFNSQFF